MAAGGGSRLFFRTGVLLVGPESAKAHPGPVCYRKGGHLASIHNQEQQDAIEQFRQEKVRIRRQLRDVQHELNKDIEQLGTTLKFINIGLVPLLLALGALVIGWRRAHRRAA